jgi:hypothetical protein
MAAALVLVLANFGCGGGCSGCGASALTPLLAPLPKEQQIEGGLQVRISPSGVTKLETALPDILLATLDAGICVPPQRFGTLGSFTSLAICGTGACAGGAQGCPARLELETVHFATPDGGPLTVDTVFQVRSLPLTITWLGATSCTMNVTSTGDAHVVAQAVLATEPQTGELMVHLAEGGVHMASLPLRFEGCSLLGPILTLLEPLANTAIGQAIIQALTPALDDALQGLLPHPLGLEGLLDAGQLVATLSPATAAHIEVRAVPGGYVDVHGGGLSTGIIAGLNSDADPSTRTPGAWHEHARCAPDLPLVLPELPREPTRGTYVLAPVPAFAGIPEADSDFTIGVSRRLLQMAGFHAVNSGALCLRVGAAQLRLPLNVGTVAVVLPSLGALADDGRAPMLVALRPQRAIDFDVGTGARDVAGNVTDPALRVHAPEMKADLYAFLDDRYVRAFTMTVDITAGIDLEVATDDTGRVALDPVLTGLDTQNLKVSVENTALLAESSDRLQMVFPMLAQLLLPVLAGQVQPVTLPDLGGFTLGDVRLGRVDAGQERFLAVYASLQHRNATSRRPARLRTSARVVAQSVPAAEVTRAAVLLPPGPDRDAGLPSVELELGAEGALPGDGLEWQWRVDGGLWHPYQRQPRLRLSTPELLLQGRHTVDVRARPVGAPARADDQPVRLELLLDSIPPRLAPHREGDLLVLDGQDLVSADAALRYQVGPAGGRLQPLDGDRIDLQAALALARAGEDHQLEVSVVDEAGNEARTRIDVGALSGAAGGGCALAPRADAPASTGAAPWAAAIVVLGSVVLAGRRRRRR